MYAFRSFIVGVIISSCDINQRPMSIQSAMTNIMNGKRIAVVEFNIGPFLPLASYGPSIIHASHAANLFHPVYRPASDPPLPNNSVCQLLLGAPGSFTPPHFDFGGLDGWLRLQAGRKLWVFAPPPKEKAFRAFFEHNLAMTNLKSEDKEKMRKMGVRGIVQEVGDTVWMPSGWMHFVINLSITVAYGGSVLRKEGLKRTLTYVRTFMSDKEQVEAATNSFETWGMKDIMRQSMNDPTHSHSQRITSRAIFNLLPEA